MLRNRLLGISAILVLNLTAMAQGVVAGGSDTPTKGIVIGSEESPGVLNPIITNSYVEFGIEQALFDNLFRTDNTGRLQPSLAISVPTTKNGGISPDGRTYTFELRQGVKWHDGTPFTAKDVVFTIKAIINEGVYPPSKYPYDRITSIKTPTDHNLVLGLSEVCPNFLQAFAMPGIIPAHAFAGLEGEALAEALGTDGEFSRHPIGTGPYKLAEWEFCSHVTLTANPDYFMGKPKVDTLKWVTSEDQAQDLAEGTVNMARLTASEYNGIKGGPKTLMSERVPGPAYLCLILNTKNEALGNPNVRKGLAYALDRKAITERNLQNAATVSNSLVLPSSYMYNPKVRDRYPYDGFDARSYLSRGGSGGRLNLRLATNSDSEGLIGIAQGVINAWQEVGVNTILASSGWVDLENRIDSTDYDVLMIEWYTSLFPNFHGMFHSTQRPENRTFGGINYSNIASRELDALIEKERTALDEETRRDAVLRIQEVLMDELPILFMYHYVDYAMAPKGLRNFKPSSFMNTDFWNVYEWDPQ